jgi:hypothetical protein
MPITITLDDREHATVLAALRYWQRIAPSIAMARDELAIAADPGEPLQPQEIEALCERINTVETHPADALVAKIAAMTTRAEMYEPGSDEHAHYEDSDDFISDLHEEVLCDMAGNLDNLIIEARKINNVSGLDSVYAQWQADAKAPDDDENFPDGER